MLLTTATRPLAALLLIASVATAADTARLDAVFDKLAGPQTPGLAVLVRQDGKTIFQRGYGARDLHTRTPIDERTDFRLASCTKQFTAMAVMLLVHDGRLHYDDPLTRFFPDFPDYARAITIRHLLTHTSGLPGYEDQMEGGPWTESRQIRDDEVLALLKKAATPKFAAGSSWSYSNSGYVLLGLLVAKAAGVPFREFLRRRIFRPLGMDHTLAYVRGENAVPDRAFGHSMRAGAFFETDQSSTSATLGDGGVYSNLEDLAKWDRALAGHTLLSDAEMQPALTPARLDDGSEPRDPDTRLPVAYGFGWFLDPYAARPRMWHYGSTRGFSTAIERFPAEKLTIIVLANRTDVDAAKLALAAADALH